MLEFLKLAFATQGVAQGAEEFLRLLNEVEEDGHAFNVEMFGLDVKDDGTQKGPVCTLYMLNGRFLFFIFVLFLTFTLPSMDSSPTGDRRGWRAQRRG